MEDKDKMISTVEAAKILGVTRQTIGCYCRQELLEAQKIGTDWIINLNDCLEFKRVRDEQKKPAGN